MRTVCGKITRLPLAQSLKKASLATGFISLAMASACVPQDVSLPIPAPGPSSTPTAASFQGFTGATSADTVGSTKVKVSWNTSADPTVVAYNIYDTTLMFSPRLIKTVMAPANFVTLTGLINENFYSFRVHAATATDTEDGNTNDVQAIPYGGVISANVISSTSATLTFNDGSNADSIDIFCQTSSDPTWNLVRTITNVTLTQSTLTGLVAGETYTCRVALQIGTTIDDNTSTVSFTPIGQASQLVYTIQPGSSTAGVALPPQPVITIMDANNNIVSAGPDATAVITLTISANSPTTGTLRGTASLAAVKGVATFTGLNIQEAGVKIITATKADTSSQTFGTPPMSLDSANFTISPGAVSATMSSIAVTPTTSQVADGNHPFAVNITLKDQYGNLISGIKPAFASASASTPVKDVSSDSLSQPTVATGPSGVASGSLSATVSGPRTLSISSPSGLNTVTTSATFIPGTATKLSFQPGFGPANSPSGAGELNQLNIEIDDAYGNAVTTGTDSTDSVTLHISTNPGGGTLLGTATVAASSGVAIFNGMGIDHTGTGYKLEATSGALTPVYSSAFNVTAGVPAKIIVTAPTGVLSGNCSSAITIQLQDSGSNPANATANTPVNLSGLGSASLYTSNSCTGTAITSPITFSTGSNTKTYYLKDNQGESLAFNAIDPSTVMATGSATININPSQLTLTGPVSVVAGQCSAVLTITTNGNNGNPGDVWTNTTLQISGLSGTSGNLYSTSNCTGTALTPSSITAAGNTAQTKIYLKDPKSETLSLSVVDPATIMTTTSTPLSINVLPSNINLTGPTTVVSGMCSTAFTIKLMDTLSNTVAAPSNTTLSINGLAGKHGGFYTSSACGGSAIGSSLVFPQGATQMNLYFMDNSAETLTLSLSDPLSVLTTSQTITLQVSPSALAITGPTTVATNVCTSAFTLVTQDGGGNTTGAVTPITATLSGAGSGGAYYSDSACTTPVTQFTFATGQSTKTFYFMGVNPAVSTPLAITATDNAGILTSATANLTVTAAPAWLGTNGAQQWFQTGNAPVSALVDGLASSYAVHFDSTKQYLFVADQRAQRVLKYDYINKDYIGWIGAWLSTGSPLTGSIVSGAVNSECLNPQNTATAPYYYYQTPGWCQGGQAQASGNYGWGSMYQPSGMADDGTNLYVTQNYAHSISRYNIATGVFEGWIGKTATQPVSPGTGLSNTCSTTTVGNPTPGWCIGGTPTFQAYAGNGALYYPRAIAYYGTSLYVGNYGGIEKYDAPSGTFLGWIGWVATGGNPTGGTAGCTTTSNARTPGWCTGGTNLLSAPSTSPGGIYVPSSILPMHISSPVAADIMFVADPTYNTITVFDINSGAFIANLASSSYTSSPQQMTYDSVVTVGNSVSTNLFIADNNRITSINVSISNENAAEGSWSITTLINGWDGKVNNPNSPTTIANATGSSGCGTLTANQNTPNWCLGGSSKQGMDETSVNQLTGIDNDGAGNLITGQGANFPAVKQWTLANGVYSGTLSFKSTSPTTWTNNTTAMAQREGYDDASFNSPNGAYINGTVMYVADSLASRVKKIDLTTGNVLGWIGGITSTPTGGVSGCTSATPYGAAPGWCTGAMYNPYYIWNTLIPSTVDGIMYQPNAVTGDGTYIYILDYALHRIQKFNMATGAYVGWIGGVGATPNNGTCTGSVGSYSGTGWCTGGMSAAGTSGTGYLYSPSSITYSNPYLYVLNITNERVDRYNASTGAYAGWIGNVATTPTGSGTGTTNTCSSTGAGTAAPGWCVGGTSAVGAVTLSAVGTFYLAGGEGITNDGTYLYVDNGLNGRIDKFLLTSGAYVASVAANWTQYTNTWTSTPFLGGVRRIPADFGPTELISITQAVVRLP